MIRFMAPDLATPSGGIKVIYRYVAHLNAVGFPARVWHGTPGFCYSDWPTQAPVETGHNVEFEPGDILVMPETGGGKWSFLPGSAPVVILCQGMDFVFADAGFHQELPGAYPGWPRAVAALPVSIAIRDFLETACQPGFPLHLIPVEIEPTFRPLPKEKRLALMPRRRHEDLIGAVQLIRRAGWLRDWEIVLIDGMTQAQVAQELGRAAVFLFGAEREGLGLPGAEAMAAGCYVVGFTGDGAKEYLTDDCASVIADSDVLGMAQAANWAMRAFESGDPTFMDKVERGRTQVTERYCAAAAQKALTVAFRGLTAPGSPALINKKTQISHYQTHAPRYGWAGSLYRGVRHRARHKTRWLANGLIRRPRH
jgi:hypothetical protein